MAGAPERTLRTVGVVRRVVRAAVAVLVLVEIVLGLGVLLQVLDANPDAGFTEWTYRNQDRLMSPFEGMFDDVEMGDENDDAVLDVSGLFAMAAYGALFIPLGMALQALARRAARAERERQAAIDLAVRDRMFNPTAPDATADAETSRLGLLVSLRERFRRRRSDPEDAAPER